MNQLSNLSVAKRLALGFALVLLLSMGVITLSISRLNALADATEEMVQNPIKTERLVSDWSRNLRTGITRTAAVARSSDPALADFFAEDSKASSKSSGELQKAVEALMFLDSEKKLFQEIGELRTIYLKNRDTIFALKKEGKVDEANALLEKQFIPDANKYAAKMDELQRNQREQVDQLGQAIQDNRTTSRRLLVALGVLSVALGALFSWLLARSVTVPLAQASDLAKRVAEGDLTANVPAHGKDEVGELVSSLALMQNNLANVVNNVRRGSESVSNASAEIAQGNNDLSARTEHQASALEETAASMEELTATVRTSADSARQANQLAASASEIAVRGGEVVSQVVSTMQEIHHSSQKINDIIGTIDGIAFQTNILALNAAVEAARAGEQGRGFAVVADEVRNLAMRTQESTRQIETIVHGLQGRTSNIVQVIQGCRQEGSDSAQQANVAMQLLSEITQDVTNIMDMTTQIAAAIEEQSHVAAEVNKNVVKIRDLSDETYGHARHNAAISEEVAQQAANLHQSVDRFQA